MGLLDHTEAAEPEAFPGQVARYFRRFPGHARASISAGVVEDGRRFFVKYSVNRRGAAGLVRAEMVLLGDGTENRLAWKGTDRMWGVILKATHYRREDRYGSVRELISARRGAIG